MLFNKFINYSEIPKKTIFNDICHANTLRWIWPARPHPRSYDRYTESDTRSYVEYGQRPHPRSYVGPLHWVRALCEVPICLVLDSGRYAAEATAVTLSPRSALTLNMVSQTPSAKPRPLHWVRDPLLRWLWPARPHPRSHGRYIESETRSYIEYYASSIDSVATSNATPVGRVPSKRTFSYLNFIPLRRFDICNG